MNNKYIFIVGITLTLAFLIYQLILKEYSTLAFCKKQVDFKLYKFRQSVKKNGADIKIEENQAIKDFLLNRYHACFRETK